MSKLAAYIRVSTEKQKADGSHENQRDQITEWAGRQDYDSVDYYEDIAISGRDDSRPEFNELMDSYEGYDAIVVRELSRFGRSPEKNVQQIIEISENGVDFISLKEDIDTTSANGRLFLRMMSAFNGWFAEQRKEQAIAAAQRRKENGEPVGRPKKLSGDLRDEAFELRSKGVSYQAIAHVIESKPKGPDEISRETIRRYCSENDQKQEQNE